MWQMIDNRQGTQILNMRALMLAREQEQVTTTQTTIRSQQSAIFCSWKFCKDKKSYITEREQATDRNPDYEPSSIYDSMYEDN